MKTSSFEDYPCWMVAICNAVGWGIYAIGLCVMFRVGIVWGVLYAAYCGWMEWRLLSGSCRYCYYFGKRCGFGKGRICSWFFTKGAELNMRAKRVSWCHVLPDFMVSLIPLGFGITVLLWDFSWFVLLLVVVLLFLGSVGTGFVRGQLACRFCRQRELGCPAEQLFNRTKQA